MISFVKLPNFLLKWIYHFAFPKVIERPCCSTSLPAFGVFSVLDFSFSTRCVVLSHYCFNMQFFNDTWLWAHAFCQNFIFYCPFRSFVHFLNVVVFLLLRVFFQEYNFVFIAWILILIITSVILTSLSPEVSHMDHLHWIFLLVCFLTFLLECKCFTMLC